MNELLAYSIAGFVAAGATASIVEGCRLVKADRKKAQEFAEMIDKFQSVLNENEEKENINEEK